MSSSFETRRVIMIIQLLITFTYIRKWTVEKAVCTHGELIKVFFFISPLTYTRLWLFSKTATNVWPTWVSGYHATAGKQTDTMTEGQSSGAHSRHWDINANPPPVQSLHQPHPRPPAAHVKDQISSWHTPPKYPEVKNHNLIKTSAGEQPEPLT